MTDVTGIGCTGPPGLEWVGFVMRADVWSMDGLFSLLVIDGVVDHAFELELGEPLIGHDLFDGDDD